MKKLMILLILVLLAATGCQKNSSEPETTADQAVQSELENTSDQEIQSGPETTANQTIQAEGAEASPSDEKMTTVKTVGKTVDSSAPATETQPEEKRPEFDYELDSSEYVLAHATVFQSGDSYCISGEKRYGGDIWLTWEQKALLDAGAVMNLVYEGRVVDRITAKMGELPNQNDGPVVSYKGEKWNPRGVMQCYRWQDPDLDEETRELISSSPYNGTAFRLVDAGDGKNSSFFEILDLIFSVMVSGDTPISPENWLATYDWLLKDHGIYEEMCNKAWTVKDFCEIVSCGVVKGDDSYLRIFEENGEVIRVEEQNMRTASPDEGTVGETLAEAEANAETTEVIPTEAETKEDTTEVIPAETETGGEKKKFEFDYELDIRSGYVIDNAKLVREGDSYVITGEKYGGDIWLTWEQKAYLDAGAVMNLICEGEVVGRITSDLEMRAGYRYRGEPGMNVWYIEKEGNNKNVGASYCWLSTDPCLDEETRALIAEYPYNGVAYRISNCWGGFGNPYLVTLDEEYRVEIPGDMPIYPDKWLKYHEVMLKRLGIWEETEEDWTMDLFYEAVVNRQKEDDFYFEIFVEDGEIVRMEQTFFGY